jgi:predicted AAA+ superfamily ATPase
MWCGKTWMAEAHANSKTKMMDPGTKEIVDADKRLAFIGDKPHVIDEWQEVPELWDITRMLIDDSGNKPGQYLLTGSSSPAKHTVAHSGTGRIARLRLRPLSLQETGVSDGTVSLSGLFLGKFVTSQVHTSLQQLADCVCYGGWPALLTGKMSNPALIAGQYLETFIASVAEKENIATHNLQKAMVALARNLGQPIKYETIAMDIIAENITDKKKLVEQAQVERLLAILESRFLIESTPGWDAPVRSKSRVRVKPKRGFVDPSLAAVLLGVNSSRLLQDGQLFGLLFEELCLRDLRIYASSLGYELAEPIKHYRDSDGLEVDAIIEMRDGRWAAIEIKLGENKVQAAINNLIRLKNKVAANPLAKNPAPEFMAVIVGATKYCRKTPEGIYVIPITCLGA